MMSSYPCPAYTFFSVVLNLNVKIAFIDYDTKVNNTTTKGHITFHKTMYNIYNDT